MLRIIPFYPIFILIKMGVKNGGISITSIPIFIIYLIRYTLLEPFRLLEIFIYDKRIRAHQLKLEPIFILGHWRSGTSHLQNILRRDPNTSSVTIFTSLFSDNYYLTESWLKRILIYLCRTFNLQYSLQRTQMDPDIPGELDSAICAMCSEHSYTWGHLFPQRFENWFQQFILFNNKQEENNWLADYDYMIRKVSYRSGGKRMIIKSPGDTARMAQLHNLYPNAKFIYIHRDPYALYNSSLYFWRVIQQQNSLQKISKAEIHRLIIETYSSLVSTYLQQREMIPASQRLEIHFKDLQEQPLKEIETIYAKLQLGPLPEKEITSFLEANRSFKITGHHLGPELEKELADKWAFAFKAWTY